MEDIDDDWESFLHNEMDYSTNSGTMTDTIKPYTSLDFTTPQSGLNSRNRDSSLNERNITAFNMDSIPKCSEIYISTKTKICYLNKNMIDIKNVFWQIPVLQYHIPQDGVIKKQTKFSSTSKSDVEFIEEQLKKLKSYDEQIIEHIDNPEGRIKFKEINQGNVKNATLKKSLDFILPSLIKKNP